MVDMTALLNVVTSDAKPPADPPDGLYPSCTVMNWKVGPCRWSEDLGTITIEARPNGWPEGAEPLGFDITKRRFFKEFNVDPSKPDTYYYLDLFASQACGVTTRERLPSEYLPECIGQEVVLAKTTRSYTAKSGEARTATDYKMVVGGSVVNERRYD